MKLTFHQWCNALAAAIIILGILVILAQLYPAEAHSEIYFNSEGYESQIYQCETEPQPCQEIEQEQQEQLAELAAEGYVESKTEQEPTHGQSNTPVPTTGLQRPIPPRIVSTSIQAQLQPVRTACALYRAHRTHATCRHFTVCHYCQQTH
jgi:competence protein ComGC